MPRAPGKIDKARMFLLVDLRGFFFRFRVWGTKKKKIKKALKMTSQLVIFRAFFFFNISRKNSKTGKANQQYLLNFLKQYHFPKNLDRTITFYSVTLKNTQTEPPKNIFFQQNK